MRFNEFNNASLFEIGAKPEPYEPHPRRKRTTFYAMVDGHKVEVSFINGMVGDLQIIYAVDDYYNRPSDIPKIPLSTSIRILSTVRDIIKRELPKSVKAKHLSPNTVSFTGEGDSRHKFYAHHVVPLISEILPNWYFMTKPAVIIPRKSVYRWDKIQLYPPEYYTPL
jgi:hypothetical protein